MKYIIDEDICEKKGMDLPSLLAVMLVKTGENIPELFDKLIKKEVLVKDIFSKDNGFYITQRWDSVCDDILLSADPAIPGDDRLDKLSKSLMDLFPKGKKEGTSTYWRGNKKDTRERLQKFFKLYGDKYTDTQIINATKKYVESFNGNYSYMRVLKYFIWKADKKLDSDGNGYIEEVSDLASFIENAGQDDEVKRDWTINIK